MTKQFVMNSIRNRAAALVYLFAEGLIPKEDLPLFCLKAKVDRATLLKTADWLVKNHQIDQNPFSWELYQVNRGEKRLNSFRVHPRIGEKFCPPCGRYLTLSRFYVYSGSDDGKRETTYSLWCKEHHRQNQNRYYAENREERKRAVNERRKAKRSINA